MGTPRRWEPEGSRACLPVGGVCPWASILARAAMDAPLGYADGGTSAGHRGTGDPRARGARQADFGSRRSASQRSTKNVAPTER